MRTEVVLKDTSVGKNGAKMRVVQNYSLPCLKTNYEKGIYELKNEVGEETLNSNLPPKPRFVKKILLASFSSHLLKNA
jgi:hypothetical protein